MRKEVNSSASRAGKEINENVCLVRRIFGKETIRRGLDQRVGISDRDDRARKNSHLYRLGRAVAVEVSRLVGDIEIDVDRFAGERRAGSEQRYLLRLSRPAIDDRAALQPAHHPDCSRVDVAKKRGDDERYYSKHAD